MWSRDKIILWIPMGPMGFPWEWKLLSYLMGMGIGTGLIATGQMITCISYEKHVQYIDNKIDGRDCQAL